MMTLFLIVVVVCATAIVLAWKNGNVSASLRCLGFGVALESKAAVGAEPKARPRKSTGRIGL
jgi:hypothetical protein